MAHLGRQERPQGIGLSVFMGWGFPGGSAGKESTCNVGDLGSIPGLERSPGEGKGYPLQYSRVSLLAQLVKNPPAMWETWVQSQDWDCPLEEGIEYSLQYSYLENSMDRGAWQAIVHEVAKSQTQLSNLHFHFHKKKKIITSA